jgi:TonB family protein
MTRLPAGDGGEGEEDPTGPWPLACRAVTAHNAAVVIGWAWVSLVCSVLADGEGLGKPVVPATLASIVPPELIADPEVTYPPEAFREGIAGPVQLEIDVNDEGQVLRAVVVAAPDPRLAWAALGAVTTLELLPAREVRPDGSERPVPVRFSYTLTFSIDAVERERVLAVEEARRVTAARERAVVNVAGRVRVAAEPGVIAGAVVTIEGTDLEAVTDDDGAFAFAGAPPGRLVLEVDAAGFSAGSVVVNERAENERADVVVYLERRAGSRNELVISERRTQREVTTRVLTQQELTRVPGTFGDAIRVVQRLPGVQRAPFGLGAVLVRGGSPEDSIVLIDGHFTRYLFHLGAGPSVLNTDFVERLEFFPGGQGARFGRAIAGAINVVTKDPATEHWSGNATVDLLATSFRLEGPLTDDKKVSLFVAGRTSYIAEVLNVGDVITRGAGLDGVNLLTLAPRYADYQGKLHWKLPSLPGMGHALSLSFLGAHDRLDLALDPSSLGPAAPSNVGITTGFHRINPVYRFRSTTTNEAGEPLVTAFVSPLGEINYSENRFDVSQFRLDIQRLGLRAELEVRPRRDVGVVFGTDDSASIFASTVDIPFFLPDERLFPRPVVSDPPRFQATDDVFGTSSSFYIDSDVTVGLLKLLVGARADLWTYYEQTRTSLDPRLAFRAQVLPFTTIKGNVGLYHQAPSPFFLSKSAGNPTLPLEAGWQTGLGIETWFSRSLDVDLQVFLRNAFDLAESVTGLAPTRFVPTGAPRIQSIGSERAYGAELLIRQRLDNGVFGWVSYTLMRSEERQDRPTGVEGAKATGWRPTEFDQTHNLSLALSCQLPLGFELGGAFRAVTGNPATLAQGGTFDADDSRYERINRPARSSRLPPFVQLDVRVDKRFVFDTWALGLFLDLQNATNHQNYEFFQYNYDFTTVQGFPGLPIVPVVGASARF